MSNNLDRKRQIGVVSALVEGCSLRSISRMFDVDRGTINRIVLRMGEGCAKLLDERMVDLPCERLEIDEVWGFVGRKQRNVRPDDDDADCAGDIWTYTALCPTTKLMPSWLCAKRNAASTQSFIDDVASRLRHRVQITTDGLRMYVDAIATAFGVDGVDFAQLVKIYAAEPAGAGRYSPPSISSTEKTPIFGEPITEYVSTSLVERSNLTARMSMRRMTRLTNAHSKKWEHHIAATALHLGHYNFVRRHSTIRVTPAMEAGIESTMWSIDRLIDEAFARAPMQSRPVYRA